MLLWNQDTTLRKGDFCKVQVQRKGRLIQLNLSSHHFKKSIRTHSNGLTLFRISLFGVHDGIRFGANCLKFSFLITFLAKMLEKCLVCIKKLLCFFCAMKNAGFISSLITPRFNLMLVKNKNIFTHHKRCSVCCSDYCFLKSSVWETGYNVHILFHIGEKTHWYTSIWICYRVSVYEN